MNKEQLAKAADLEFDGKRRLKGPIINIKPLDKEQKHLMNEDVYGYEKKHQGFEVYCWWNFFEDNPYIQLMILILDVQVIDSKEVKKAIEAGKEYFKKYEEIK